MLTAAGDVESLTAALRAEGISFELEVGSRLVDASTSQIIVTPSDIFELSKSLALATEHDIAVTPMGGGTRLGLGNVPDRIGVAVSLAGLGGVVDYNPADLTATFQAGITIDSLQRAVGEHGQFLAVDPPLPQRATIGGTLAVGTSGPTKWQYGSLRDVVIGMRVVQPDGIVTKSGGQVVKNVSGYDMSRLHIGGLGTLGITAEASFKLDAPAREGGYAAGELWDSGRRRRSRAGGIQERSCPSGADDVHRGCRSIVSRGFKWRRPFPRDPARRWAADAGAAGTRKQIGLHKPSSRQGRRCGGRRCSRALAQSGGFRLGRERAAACLYQVKCRPVEGLGAGGVLRPAEA